jgi:chemotaxis signal transduction protein
MLADAPVEATGPLVLFRVGPGLFAVLLEEVFGIVDPAEAGAGGEFSFQGHPVAVVDARELWWKGLERPVPTPSPAVIVVGRSGGSTALIIDRVEGIEEGAEMRPLPALVAPFVRGVFRGVVLRADGGCLVVDPAALSGAAAVGGQRGPGKA